ncbi:MAG: hypothetical protein ABSG21_15145 [Spirochaetia bacterium]
MRRSLCAVILFLLAAGGLWANMAAPIEDPPYSGNIFSFAADNPLRIEKEALFLDLSSGNTEEATSSAVYTILNPLHTAYSTDLVFLTPAVKHISIEIDGSPAEIRTSTLGTQRIPWASESVRRRITAYPAATFSLSLAAGERKIVTVRFFISPGWNSIIAELGPSYPQAAHFLNMAKGRESTLWYVYDLRSAANFGGGFGGLSLSVKVPRNAEIITEMRLDKARVEADAEYYTAELAGPPQADVDIYVVNRIDYNSVGFMAGIGLGVPLTPLDAGLLLKTMLDAYFLNHQISIGLEGDPFHGILRASLQYTLFPPGGTGYGYRGVADFRVGGNVLLGLYDGYLPNLSIGFRLFAGVRLGIPLEIGYEIYPWSQDGVFREDLSLMMPISF